MAAPSVNGLKRKLCDKRAELSKSATMHKNALAAEMYELLSCRAVDCYYCISYCSTGLTTVYVPYTNTLVPVEKMSNFFTRIIRILRIRNRVHLRVKGFLCMLCGVVVGGMGEG